MGHREDEVTKRNFTDENIDLSIDDIMEELISGAANAFSYADNEEGKQAATKFLGRLKERVNSLNVQEIL